MQRKTAEEETRQEERDSSELLQSCKLETGLQQGKKREERERPERIVTHMINRIWQRAWLPCRTDFQKAFHVIM